MTVIYNPSDVERALDRVEDMVDTAEIAGRLKTMVVPMLQESARTRFATEGADVGGWEPLHPQTIHIRQSMNFGAGPINYRTGSLMDFVTSNEGNVSIAGGDAVLSWPDEDYPSQSVERAYAAAQNGRRARSETKPGGGKRTRATQPARPVAELTEPDRQFIEDFILEEFI